MKKEIINNNEISEQDIMNMMNDTSRLLAKQNVDNLSNVAIAYNSSNALANKVEFWKWMDRNYANSSIFSSNVNMQNYINSGVGKEKWVNTQLQGKGYEWDWIQNQRKNITSFFNQYDAGDVANRAASDVTEANILTGKTKEYQMKAYLSKTNPDLASTPTDMAVVTNSEKVDVVQQNGYSDVQKFQDKGEIRKATNQRMKEIKSGKASPGYNISNVGGVMAKAGIVGAVIGMGTEAIVSYKQWKNGNLTDEEYSKEILKSGASQGITGAATAGVMIPISSAITAAGITSLITIPIVFVVGAAIGKIVAPCFGRGQYRTILNEAKYYRDIQYIYGDMVKSMESASQQYEEFVMNMQKQMNNHEQFKKMSMDMNKELKKLYDSI